MNTRGMMQVIQELVRLTDQGRVSAVNISFALHGTEDVSLASYGNTAECLAVALDLLCELPLPPDVDPRVKLIIDMTKAFASKPLTQVFSVLFPDDPDAPLQTYGAISLEALDEIEDLVQKLRIKLQLALAEPASTTVN
jgi:hypothetical protein